MRKTISVLATLLVAVMTACTNKTDESEKNVADSLEQVRQDSTLHAQAAEAAEAAKKAQADSIARADSIAQVEAEKAAASEREQIVRQLYSKCILIDGIGDSYSFLENHCSKSFLKELKKDYSDEYEGDGYAIWDFRAAAFQDGGGKTKIISVTSADNNSVIIKYKDMGIPGTSKIKFVEEDGKWLIDGVKHL